uniref:Uncharacterized protein n=1 Tax=Mus spicilegus TaxID=10103 RepID=A0A8C6IF13_MUSSI
MAELDLVAELQSSAGAALLRCFTRLWQCQISIFLFLKCQNTRFTHLVAHCRLQ